MDAGDFIYTRPCSHKICGEGWEDEGRDEDGGEGEDTLGWRVEGRECRVGSA